MHQQVHPGTRRTVVVGDTNLARRVCASLVQSGAAVHHLIRPSDDELRTALAEEPHGVAVLFHEDAAALRYALAVAHIRSRVPIVVTIFDRTIADEVLRLLPQCDVTSPADLAAPALAGPCATAGMTALRHDGHRSRAVRVLAAVPRAEHWVPRRTPWRSALGRVTQQLRPHDAGTRIMLAGLAGMLAAGLGDWVWLLHLGHHPVQALFDAARVVATVGPATAAPDSSSYQLYAAAAMLTTVVFSAMFTAGLVDRMLSPRLVNLIGARTVPRSDHVIVVGMGQVGLRLCAELRRLGIPVVGVERDIQAPSTRLARSLGIPLITAHGDDRTTLDQLNLRRARALAAVSSDDLDNLAVAITAQGVSPGTRIVLRAGEHEAIAETRSLLPLGTIRDVTSMAAAYVLARLEGRAAAGVVAHHHHVFVESPDGEFSVWAPPDKERCCHVDGAPPPW